MGDALLSHRQSTGKGIARSWLEQKSHNLDMTASAVGWKKHIRVMTSPQLAGTESHNLDMTASAVGWKKHICVMTSPQLAGTVTIWQPPQSAGRMSAADWKISRSGLEIDPQ